MSTLSMFAVYLVSMLVTIAIVLAVKAARTPSFALIQYVDGHTHVGAGRLLKPLKGKTIEETAAGFNASMFARMYGFEADGDALVRVLTDTSRFDRSQVAERDGEPVFAQRIRDRLVVSTADGQTIHPSDVHEPQP